MEYNLTNESCSPNEGLSQQDIRIIGISGIVASSISIALCTLVILLMIVFKKYEFGIQRLILYLDISILLNAINQLLQRSAYDTIYSNESYCIGLAIFSQYSGYCILLSMVCALFEVILRIVFKKEGKYIEIVYLFIIYILPIGVCFIPYIFDAYGAINTLCTITVRKNCEQFTTGLILEAVLWWTPLYGTIVFALISYPLFYIAIRRDRRKYSAIVEVDRNRIAEKTLKEVGYFKWLPVLFIVLSLIPIATMIHDFFRPNSPIVALWTMTTIVKGIQGGIIATVISLDPKTFKRLTIRQLQSAFKNNVMMQNDIKDYPVNYDEFSDSLKNSNTIRYSKSEYIM